MRLLIENIIQRKKKCLSYNILPENVKRKEQVVLNGSDTVKNLKALCVKNAIRVYEYTEYSNFSILR